MRMRQLVTTLLSGSTLLSFCLLLINFTGLKESWLTSEKSGNYLRWKGSLPSQNCDLCEKQWVFILAAGRSGSTTVLEMLNSVPGMKLTGENDGAVNHFFSLPFFPGVNHPEKYPPNKFVPAAFEHGPVRVESLRCWVQEYFKLIAGKGYSGENLNVTGFKTIRVFDPKVIDFMLQIFPCAKFVVNYRKDVHAGRSHWNTAEQRQILNEKLLNITQIFPKRTFSIPLEDFSVDNFNKLIEWIGFSDCRFKNVNHANDKGGISSDYSVKVRGSCALNNPEVNHYH